MSQPATPILNPGFKHPDDSWYHIEPMGEHLNVAAGVVQIIDDRAVRSIVEHFNVEADRPGFSGVLVDIEHNKNDLGKETRARGWLMRLEGRADGIYGKIRWTGIGRAEVDGGEYRFFSTEYDPAEMEAA